MAKNKKPDSSSEDSKLDLDQLLKEYEKLQEQKEKVEFVQKRKQIKTLRDEKYKLYIPNGKVEEFLDKFGSCNYFVSLLSGANGVGKTTVLVNIVAHICWESDNEFFQQKIFKAYPYDLKAIRIVSNHNTLKETLIPEMKKWFPKGRYEVHKDGKLYEYRWETETGWTITILTFDQPATAHESANVSLVLFDEPPPRSVFIANVARLRRGGQIAILATLLKGSEWIYEDIMEGTVKSEEGDAVGDSFYTVVEAEDACEEHGIRGHLKHEMILKMASRYDEDDKQARIFGMPQFLTGLVFKEFDSNIHVINPFVIDKEDYLVWQSLDTHPRVQEAAVWVAVDRKGRYYVVDELWFKSSTKELAARIKEKDEKYRMQKWLIDPSAYVDDDRILGNTAGSRKSFASSLKDYGLSRYVAGSKRRQDAVRAIKDNLHYSSVNGEMIYPPNLYIFSTCERLIWEMRHWHYQEHSAALKDRKDKSGTAQDKDDHAIEALGRILIEAPKFIEAPKQRIRPIKDSTTNLKVYD